MKKAIVLGLAAIALSACSHRLVEEIPKEEQSEQETIFHFVEEFLDGGFSLRIEGPINTLESTQRLGKMHETLDVLRRIYHINGVDGNIYPRIDEDGNRKLTEAEVERAYNNEMNAVLNMWH